MLSTSTKDKLTRNWLLCGYTSKYLHLPYSKTSTLSEHQVFLHTCQFRMKPYHNYLLGSRNFTSTMPTSIPFSTSPPLNVQCLHYTREKLCTQKCTLNRYQDILLLAIVSHMVTYSTLNINLVLCTINIIVRILALPKWYPTNG